MKLSSWLIWLIDFISSRAAGACARIWPKSASCNAHCVCVCSCVCPPGFEGQRCEINPDDCEDNDCENNSTCIDGVNNYTCICPPNYTGAHTHTHAYTPCLFLHLVTLCGWCVTKSLHDSTHAHTHTYKIIFSALLDGKLGMDSLSAVTWNCSYRRLKEQSHRKERGRERGRMTERWRSGSVH